MRKCIHGNSDCAMCCVVGGEPIEFLQSGTTATRSAPECPHGSLARCCEVCDLTAALATAERERDEARAARDAVSGDNFSLGAELADVQSSNALLMAELREARRVCGDCADAIERPVFHVHTVVAALRAEAGKNKETP